MSKEKKGHRPIKPSVLPWSFCARCGLIYLKNEATQRAIRASCTADEGAT